ncbi:LytR family transcriptional regulator [Raineyella fluvialis]|uniref:LytR family transcriptional regulator n=2 Tax=Raineyella fluvialis TaxID=2662261 RepID=A0A5Q2FK67_9ACTN|nr:LytR family transcriptional regulator [Raineyella fluvialis]
MNGPVDMLIMGLDSRLDENGKPLPEDIYNALHAGEASTGGLNSNVLMYVHIPADGSAASVFSIPRDDYVDIPGCPDGVCKAKIKEAYGLAFDASQRALARQGKTGDDAYQKSRDAGRSAEIATVNQFLGVRINHFTEVTMVAFFQIAQVVQPVTVCVKQDTQDSYSGANFHAGKQQINAQQAVAFVRQRRDNVHPQLEFTDLDRSRRQQAFLVSLFNQLKQANTFLNPAKLSGIIGVAKQNLVIDSGLNPLSLAPIAANLSGTKLHFYTLPVERFGTDPSGQSVNIVDPTAVRQTVQRLLNPPPPSTPTPTPTPSPTSSASRTTTKKHPTTPTPSAVAPTPVDATGGGTAGPAPTALTDLSGAGVACVK